MKKQTFAVWDGVEDFVDVIWVTNRDADFMSWIQAVQAQNWVKRIADDSFQHFPAGFDLKSISVKKI